jgi:uncharacterized protein (TIGR02145 family)
MVDNAFSTDYTTPCQEIKALIDTIANDFATDGLFSDSLTATIAEFSYLNNTSNTLRILKQYAGLGECTPTEAGNTYKAKRTIFVGVSSFDYAICTGTSWSLLTKEEYDDATAIIQHQTGTMTDPRDGKTYKTTSFTTNGKKYEWMAENLQYASDKYTWTKAMAIDDTLVSKPKASSILNGDSIHQGICPENWHIPGFWEWKDLLQYVGSPNKLYSKNWNKINFTGVQLEDNIDFSAEPTFFEPYIDCDGCSNPYANFITYTLAPTLDSTTTSYQHYFVDYFFTYIPTGDNEYVDQVVRAISREKLNFVSVLFGSDSDTPYTYNPYPNFTIIVSTKTNFEVNVRCVKN